MGGLEFSDDEEDEAPPPPAPSREPQPRRFTSKTSHGCACNNLENVAVTDRHSSVAPIKSVHFDMAADFIEADHNRDVSDDWSTFMEDRAIMCMPPEHASFIEHCEREQSTSPDFLEAHQRFIDQQEHLSSSKLGFEVRGALAAPADETVPVETSAGCSWTNICELEPMAQDILNMLPKVTLLKAALDSGAGDHVASAMDLEGIKIHESEGSRRGRNFSAANGDNIPNLGEAKLGLRDVET